MEQNMSEWKQYKFSDFVDINPSVKFKQGNIYSYVEMKDLTDGQRYCEPSVERVLKGGTKFQNGDTLFARITPCLENGKICQVRSLKDGKGFGSTEFLVFRGKESVSTNDFVFYLSRWDEIRDYAENHFEGTSGRQRVPKACFDNLHLQLPELKEQTIIADALGVLDDKIDLLHRQNKTLEQLADTLFRQWFVEEVDENSEPGIVSDLFLLQRGFDLPIQNRSDGSYDIITASGINGKHNSYKIEGPGVVTGRSGLLGKVFYVFDNFWPLNTSLFISEYRRSTPLYAYFLLKSLNLETLNGGSAVPTLNRNHVHSLPVDIPSKDKMVSFETISQSFFSKIENNIKQIRSLTQLRDTLLPRLMSGEIKVK
jgi:type I restriction enzyme S subunit